MESARSNHRNCSRFQHVFEGKDILNRGMYPNTHFQQAYGFAELPEKKMTTDALFSTCSTTKAFTAAATSMAIQDSKATASPFDWDTPLSTLIPDDFVLADDYYTKNVTIEDLLSHRSGMAP